MLRHPGCLNADVLICSETSDPQILLLGEKNLIPLLKCLFLLCFFMEKGDVYPAPFFIPSSPSVLLMWDQLSDGCLKTSITTLEVLVCVPWAQIPMHAERRGAHERAAPLCLIHPRVAGPCSQHPSPFSLRKTLSWVVAISTSCSWWRSVTASVFQWWWYESSQYLLRTVTTQIVTMLSNCL